MPLEILYNNGVPHHRLLFPFPVDASIDYTSVTVRYFLNPFITANGGANSASSIRLRSFGINGLLTMPMSAADLTALLNGVTANDTIQAHFTDRAGIPRVFDVTAVVEESDQASTFAYADYVRANVTLMNYVYDLENAAPADNSQITLVIGGGDTGGGTTITDTLTLTSGDDTWTMTATEANRAVTIALNGTNAFRLVRQSDGTVDMVVTGNITGNGTIT